MENTEFQLRAIIPLWVTAKQLVSVFYKNDHINILSPTFSQNPVLKIKNCILYIASEYMFSMTIDAQVSKWEVLHADRMSFCLRTKAE